MRYAFVAVVLTGFWACSGGFTSAGGGGLENPDGGIGGVGIGIDAGDAGEAGDGGDAGNNFNGGDGGIFDGGCAATAILNANVIDECLGTSGISEPASVSLQQQSCTAVINFAGGATPCQGSISGAQDGFTGTCSSFSSCTSASLPGEILCSTGPGTFCTIQVCAGSCSQ